MKKSLEQFQARLQSTTYDVAWISSTANVFYLTGFHCEPHERLLALLVFRDSSKAPLLVFPKMEEEQVRATGWEGEMLGYYDSDDVFALIQHRIGNSEQGEVAIEKDVLTVTRYERLQQFFQGASIASVDMLLKECRTLKTEDEMKYVRQAAALADEAVEIGMNYIDEGKTELDILGHIEYELKKRGVRQMAFNTMVLTGANSALPHGVPGQNKVKKGDFVLFDLGVVVDGYCSDITRTFGYHHLSEEQEKIYHTVLDANLAALQACTLGTPLGAIDGAARDVITKAGYGDFFPHRVGHGLGIEVHEFPSMSGDNKDPLAPGMLFTVEPGIYVPKVGGVRIEDDVYITESGKEIVTHFPKELIIL